MGKHIVRLLSLFVAGGFSFLIDLMDSYLAIDAYRDSFYFDLLLASLLFVLTVTAALGFFVGLFRSQKRSSLVFHILFVVCASLSFWFGSDLGHLSDELFLWLEEPRFQSKIRAAGGQAAAVVLHWQSSAASSKLFVYSGSRSLPDGRLSKDAIDVFERQLDAPGCKVYSEHLRDNFYTLLVDCS